MLIDILRLSHACIRVTNLERALYFYRDLLGFIETETKGEYAYLRGIEEGQHHSLVLKRATSPGLSYLGFRVRRPEELDKAKELIEKYNLKVRKFKEEAVEDAIIFESPAGIPIVLYYNMEYVADPRIQRLQFSIQRGARPARIDHAVVMVNNIDKEYEFYHNVFGFYETEGYIDDEGKRVIAFLTKFGHSHEIAIGKYDKTVPALSHINYYVQNVDDIIRAADILGSKGLKRCVETGVFKHRAASTITAYFRDLDGNRIELSSQDYFILDPDKLPPLEYPMSLLSAEGDFWGPFPFSVLNDVMPVEDIFTGEIKTEIHQRR
ncbi:VOC family protein [Sulfolobus sp. E11-6]|uniref:VOC family protein n=1 Tax=Sulfolobus sp. E11-6 TaxID=2663020 RepID=UPI0012973D73|nr:VOC family protein [Sulfolobus sp. E11-6]QGA69665.1 3,4-dihydroxyphenylacetate 2,3-dioxygenase [Sulfolobus sp. E11-6]